MTDTIDNLNRVLLDITSSKLRSPLVRSIVDVDGVINLPRITKANEITSMSSITLYCDLTNLIHHDIKTAIIGRSFGIELPFRSTADDAIVIPNVTTLLVNIVGNQFLLDVLDLNRLFPSLTTFALDLSTAPPLCFSSSTGFFKYYMGAFVRIVKQVACRSLMILFAEAELIGNDFMIELGLALIDNECVKELALINMKPNRIAMVQVDGAVFNGINIRLRSAYLVGVGKCQGLGDVSQV